MCSVSSHCVGTQCNVLMLLKSKGEIDKQGMKYRKKQGGIK